MLGPNEEYLALNRSTFTRPRMLDRHSMNVVKHICMWLESHSYVTDVAKSISETPGAHAAYSVLPLSYPVLLPASPETLI